MQQTFWSMSGSDIFQPLACLHLAAANKCVCLVRPQTRLQTPSISVRRCPLSRQRNLSRRQQQRKTRLCPSGARRWQMGSWQVRSECSFLCTLGQFFYHAYGFCLMWNDITDRRGRNALKSGCISRGKDTSPLATSVILHLATETAINLQVSHMSHVWYATESQPSSSSSKAHIRASLDLNSPEPASTSLMLAPFNWVNVSCLLTFCFKLIVHEHCKYAHLCLLILYYFYCEDCVDCCVFGLTLAAGQNSFYFGDR